MLLQKLKPLAVAANRHFLNLLLGPVGKPDVHDGFGPPRVERDPKPTKGRDPMTLEEKHALYDKLIADRARRDLADYGSTVSNIARSIRNAGIRIRTVHEFGDPMPADVLPDLRQAQADLAALITALEEGAP